MEIIEAGQVWVNKDTYRLTMIIHAVKPNDKYSVEVMFNSVRHQTRGVWTGEQIRKEYQLIPFNKPDHIMNKFYFGNDQIEVYFIDQDRHFDNKDKILIGLDTHPTCFSLSVLFPYDEKPRMEYLLCTPIKVSKEMQKAICLHVCYLKNFIQDISDTKYKLTRYGQQFNLVRKHK